MSNIEKLTPGKTGVIAPDQLTSRAHVPRPFSCAERARSPFGQWSRFLAVRWAAKPVRPRGP